MKQTSSKHEANALNIHVHDLCLLRVCFIV